MSFLGVAPYLSLDTAVEGGALRVSGGLSADWFVRSLESDLAESAGLKPPWLPRTRSERTSAEFALPEGGVTLPGLWATLSLDQQAGVTLSLLKTLTRAWPVSMFPRSGVLCGTDGVLWLVPPFRTLVDGASKTWDDFQFDEYCLGGMSKELTHGLALTLQRLLVRVPLYEFFQLGTLTPALPSSKVAWLSPLDELVSAANDELWNKRAPAPGAADQWASTLAVLEDQHQQSSALTLGELVKRAWPRVDEAWRWGR